MENVIFRTWHALGEDGSKLHYFFPDADRGARTELARTWYRKDGGQISLQLVKVRLLRLTCRVGDE